MRSLRYLLPLALVLAACSPVQPTAQLLRGQALSAASVPSDDKFVTIKAEVEKILPEDNEGLPHQNFVVTVVSPERGDVLEVNNDTHYGTKVPGLKVGDRLTIRGVIYHGSKKDGIHWTHKADEPGDAGYIEKNGKRYE